MKRTFFKLSIIFLLIASLIGVLPGINLFKNPSTVRASGDLTIIWGVPDGDSIFVIANAAPGDVQERIVTVSNGAGSSRQVGIKAIKTAGSGNIESVLNVVISEGVTDLYGGSTSGGPKTLAQFFSESSSLEFIPLSTLLAGASTNYKIKITFDPSAGNEFQNTSVTFDLQIGTGFQVPEECLELNLSTTPIFGTAGNDTIHGTQKSELIMTFEGNDKVFGKSGDDCIIGGEGNDQLRGELGSDVILGEGGNDFLIGALGKDIIFGGLGDDQIRGEVGDDSLFGEAGNDNIKGGTDTDIISGGTGNDTLDGEAGNDTINGDEDNDSLKGSSGNDNLIGGTGNDTANGSSGTDTCVAEVETSCEF